MTLKRFKRDDIYNNVVTTHPDIEFLVNDGNVYYNREVTETGNHQNNIKHVPKGYISLYEQNIDRPAEGLTTRFITKDSTRGSFRTISTSDEFFSAELGDRMSMPYPLSASISRIFIPAGIEFGIASLAERVDEPKNKRYIRSLHNYIEYGQKRSSEFTYGDLGTRDVNLICIPSVFYGSGIKKDSLKLSYFVTGTLVARLEEKDSSGVLVETFGPRAGTTAGLLLKEQGIAILTGSWDLATADEEKNSFFGGGLVAPSWLSFGTGIDEVGEPSEANGIGSQHSYLVECQGINKIPTLTMLAHADYDEMNYSNNPTFMNGGFITGSITSGSYIEEQFHAHNIKKSNYENYDEKFEKITYISKVGIYDEYKNLIAIATLANPIKKTEKLDYTIKLKMDF